MPLAFETVLRGIVAFFGKGRAGNSQPRIFAELLQKELEMIRLERDIRINVADDLELQ